MVESDLLAYRMPITKIIEDESLEHLPEASDVIVGKRYTIPMFRVESERFHLRRMPMRGNISNSRTIKIERAKLVTKLKENRERHQAIYEEALKGYDEALRQALVEMGEKATELGSNATSLDDFDRNKLFAPVTGLQRPRHAIDSYNEAIEVFVWDEAVQVELTIQEFRCYVLDKWDWQENWLAESAHYSKSARMAMAEL